MVLLISEILVGIVVLAIGLILNYFNLGFGRPLDLIIKIVGLILVVIGIIAIIAGILGYSIIGA